MASEDTRERAISVVEDELCGPFPVRPLAAEDKAIRIVDAVAAVVSPSPVDAEAFTNDERHLRFYVESVKAAEIKAGDEVLSGNIVSRVVDDKAQHHQGAATIWLGDFSDPECVELFEASGIWRVAAAPPVGADEEPSVSRPVGVGKDGSKGCSADQASTEQSREHVRDGDHHENVEAGSSPRVHPEAGAVQPVCEVCGDEKILMEPDGSKAQPCYACQPAGTTLEQASRPYPSSAAPGVTEGQRTPTDNTRWQGLAAEQAIARLEERLGNSRRSGNVLRAHIVAAMMSNRENSQAILLRALAVTGHEPQRPRRARRRARRLLLQAAEILEDRP